MQKKIIVSIFLISSLQLCPSQAGQGAAATPNACDTPIIRRNPAPDTRFDTPPIAPFKLPSALANGTSPEQNNDSFVFFRNNNQNASTTDSDIFSNRKTEPGILRSNAPSPILPTNETKNIEHDEFVQLLLAPDTTTAIRPNEAEHQEIRARVAINYHSPYQINDVTTKSVEPNNVVLKIKLIPLVKPIPQFNNNYPPKLAITGVIVKTAITSEAQ